MAHTCSATQTEEGASDKKPQCQRHIAQRGDRHGGVDDFNTLSPCRVVAGLKNTQSY